MKTLLFKLDNLSDEELISDYRSGSNECLEELLKRYMPFVKRSVFHFFVMGSETEDLTQEAMIGLYQAIERYDMQKGPSFRKFAELCVSRAIVTAIRKGNRRKHTFLNHHISIHKLSSEFVHVLAKGEFDPIFHILKKERIESVNLLRAKLSGLEKKVFGKFLDGLSYIQIAKHLNESEKTIDNAIQRIRKKAKLYLGSLFNE